MMLEMTCLSKYSIRWFVNEHSAGVTVFNRLYHICIAYCSYAEKDTTPECNQLLIYGHGNTHTTGM